MSAYLPNFLSFVLNPSNVWQALERHREMSDIVRIERDQLQAEVIQLRDVLKAKNMNSS